VTNENLLLSIENIEQKDGLWDLYFFEEGLVAIKLAKLNTVLIGALTGGLGAYFFLKYAKKKAARVRESLIISFSSISNATEDKLVVSDIGKIELKKGFIGNKVVLVDLSGKKKIFFLKKNDFIKAHEILRPKTITN
jgi:hypothetical protein